MNTDRKKAWVENSVFLVIILVLGLLIQNTYYLQILTFIGINTLLALGLNMLMGYAGQISLGHAAFYGIGAYTTAILSGAHGISHGSHGVCRCHGRIGCLCCRAAHPQAFRILPGNGNPGVRHDREHSSAGMEQRHGRCFRFCRDSAAGGGPVSFMSERNYFFLVWGAVLIAILICRRLLASRMGRALRSIHDGENASLAVGVNTHALKLQIFMFAAALGAVAGFYMPILSCSSARNLSGSWFRSKWSPWW